MNKQCIMHQFTPLAQEANFDRKVRILIELHASGATARWEHLLTKGKTCIFAEKILNNGRRK